MPDHEDATVFARRFHFRFRRRDIERNGLFDENVLAVLHSFGRILRVELCRQGQNDSVNVRTGEQFIDRNIGNAKFGSESFGICRIGVGDCLKGAEALQGTNVVAAPIAATQNRNTRCHETMPLLMHSSLSVQMMENKTKPVRRVLDRFSFPTYTAAIPCRNNALSHRKRRR